MATRTERLVIEAPEVFADVDNISLSPNFCGTYKAGEQGSTTWLECGYNDPLGPYDAILEDRLGQPTPWPVEDRAAELMHFNRSPVVCGDFPAWKDAQRTKKTATVHRMATSENYPDAERTASQRLAILEQVRELLKRAPQVPQPA